MRKSGCDLLSLNRKKKYSGAQLNLNTTIVPMGKNKNGNMSDTSNYRPVAAATVVSKLLQPPLPLNGNLKNTSYMKQIPNYEL